MNEFEKYKEKQRIADEGIEHILMNCRQGKKWDSYDLNKYLNSLVKKITSVGEEENPF